MKWIYRIKRINHETGEILTEKEYQQNWYTIRKEQKTYPEKKNMIKEYIHICGKKQYKQQTLWQK